MDAVGSKSNPTNHIVLKNLRRPYVQRLLNHEDVGELPKHLIKFSCFRSVVLKVCGLRYLGVPLKVQTIFIITTKMSFAFFTPILSQVSRGVFQRLQDMQL